MRRVLVLVALLFGMFAMPRAAEASCSGAGLVWSCTTGTTTAQIATAYSSASDGAVFTFDAGTYSWSRLALSLTKGITLICATAPPADAPLGTIGNNGNGAATVSPCTITASGNLFSFGTGSSTKLYRVLSGFVVNTTGANVFWTCDGGNCDGTITQVRIDHNTINMNGSSEPVVVLVGEGGGSQSVYGVLDHSKITMAISGEVLHWVGTTAANHSGEPLGTINNFFVENNDVVVTNLDNLGTGCTDGWAGSSEVWRFNDSTNCRLLQHAATHSGGPANTENYKNNVRESDNDGLQGYRLFHHQGGGSWMNWSNTAYWTGTGSHATSDVSVIQNYCDFSTGPCIDNANTAIFCDGLQGRDGNRAPTATYRGYPCWHQPGRLRDATYLPIYQWDVKWSDGTRIDMEYNGGGSGTDYSANHMQVNREWYTAVSASAQSSATSPFNATTGAGFGTLANRPTTCTTSSETAFGAGAAGVGYFATDQGTWYNGGAGGVLYTCSATDTWSVLYTPFTYPHPLVGAAGPSDPPASNGGRGIGRAIRRGQLAMAQFDDTLFLEEAR